MEPVLHKNTAQAVKDFLNQPSHSLLITAPVGSGKFYIAQYIAQQLLGQKNLLSHPYFAHLQPEDNVIPIDSVRQLKSFLQLRTTGDKSIRRVVVIERAETMNAESQNATLKFIEEPPDDTVIILTASSPQALLPTIRSRLQHIVIQKPNEEQVLKHFENQASESELQKVYLMSNGHVGLMYALLQRDEEQHPLVASIDTAKELYKQPTYERLLRVNELSDTDLEVLCQGLYSVAHAALWIAVEKKNAPHIKKWYRTCQLIHSTQDELRYKPQTKLLLTNLLMNL